MQDADITSITRELAGLVGERYVFPDLAAEIGRLLESRLAGGRYAVAPDEGALAAALTQDLQSLNGDKHLRLLHSGPTCPNAGTKRRSSPPCPATRPSRQEGSPGPNGSTATSATSTCGRCSSPRRWPERRWPPR